MLRHTQVDHHAGLNVTNVIKHFKQLRIPRSTREACRCIRMVKRSRWTYNLFFYAGWNVTSAMKQFEQIRIRRNTLVKGKSKGKGKGIKGKGPD